MIERKAHLSDDPGVSAGPVTAGWQHIILYFCFRSVVNSSLRGQNMGERRGWGPTTLFKGLHIVTQTSFTSPTSSFYPLLMPPRNQAPGLETLEATKMQVLPQIRLQSWLPTVPLKFELYLSAFFIGKFMLDSPCHFELDDGFTCVTRSFYLKVAKSWYLHFNRLSRQNICPEIPVVLSIMLTYMKCNAC